MNDRMIEALNKSIPEPAPAFHAAVESALSKARALDRPKRKIRAVLVVALCALLLAGAALALSGQIDLFNFFGNILGDKYTTVQPEAYALSRTDIASYSFEHVDVSIRQAAYDGRVLRVLYSVRDRAATAPFENNAEGFLSDDFAFPAAKADNVSWTGCDWMTVNGVDVCLTGAMGARAGEQNGEVLVALESDLREMWPGEEELGDTLTISLPIAKQHDENGNLVIGEDGHFVILTPDELTFTLSAVDLPGVRALALPEPVAFSDYTLTVTEFLITPIRVYMILSLEMNEGVTAERALEIEDSWGFNSSLIGKDGAPLLSMDASYGDNLVYQQSGDDWVFTLPETGPLVATVWLDFVPAEEYPGTFRLVSGEGDEMEIENTSPTP